ncbi:BON domain-containing protein [Candidatus Synechococcus calcipolaris G9]|uniref:BON domain-containing protein n=1 Tax=Candidatus Synechococcus calcipolaris G9 TaxID=1497997 RepID=A0ABT6EXR1_9SYNE|nr:BON domain-containing protein [Candidatus Synechococcus calcipolaris]MDG2990157.1 BON domain-containing protein [Candidatus Synechococcus calcipolaris G9]
MNANDPKNPNRTIHRQYKDSSGIVHTEYKDAHGNIRTEYRDAQGVLHNDDNAFLDSSPAEQRRINADSNITKTVLVGILFVFFGSLIAGTVYYMTQRNNPQSVTVMNVPDYAKDEPQPSPQAPQSTETNINITSEPSSSQPAQAPQSSETNVTVLPSSQSSPEAATPSPGRSDSDIKGEITSKFQASLPNNRLNVAVQNGNVTVSGTVEKPEQMQQIQSLASSVSGVKNVNVSAATVSSF